MVSDLIGSSLFFEMTELGIKECIKCSKSQIKNYEKHQIIFTQLDPPAFLYVLIKGTIAICKDSLSGKRGIVTTFDRSGDIFGEVYLFLEKQNYDYYSVATQNSTILEIPKSFFYHCCPENCDNHAKLTHNMLGILAQKAYYLNQKLQLLSSGSLRQKIIKYLLSNADKNRVVTMPMNREEFADFLNVARPSLSRELIKMKNEEIILIKGNTINIPDLDALESFL